MKDKGYAAWAVSRAKGRNKYIFFNGVLLYGIPMFIFSAFIINKPLEGGYNVISMAQSLGIWSFAGMVIGINTWFNNERQYRKATKTHEKT
ncbi:MAG: hypothetical protein KC426_08580 [Oceanospirillaceae bacterium]|nr:hypothetical protein [Oceanospirillaceae bacterium]